MRVHFSTDDLPPRDREQYWLDVITKEVVKLTFNDQPDPTTFRGQVDTHSAGRFTLYEFQTSHRAEYGQVRTHTSDRYALCRVLSEEVYVAAPTRARPKEVRLSPGDIGLSPCEWPALVTKKGEVHGRGIVIPGAVLSPLLASGRVTAPVGVPAGSPLGSLLGTAFDAAVAQVPLLSPELGDAVLQNLCGLVALACGASEEGRSSAQEPLRAARLEMAKRYIDQHLSEPGLSPASTAAALRISVRQLHLLFEPIGISFTQFVTQRRLLQCRTTLTSPAGASRSVADIAFGWGFNSLATFYRAFEREFGLSPTALRAAGAGG
jgi:AraC-like DNA-binding protein